MVRALEQEQEDYRSRLYHFKGMQENAGGGGRHAKSLSVENGGMFEDSSLMDDDVVMFRSHPGVPRSRNHEPDQPSDHKQKIPWSRNEPAEQLGTGGPKGKDHNQKEEIEQMKERFAKLLLGEDMSGGGKGVSSALALSNAITNLAASVFGEQWRLEPMSAERKARWRREIDWLLSVTDHIVEFVPSQQKNKDGSNMEIMVTRQRFDLLMNIPALRKLDAMLIDCLDNFRDQTEFYYVSRDAPDSEKGGAKRKDNKWWLPTPKVPQMGLSENARKFLQHQKDSVNQVLKAAMAINAQVLSEMEIPENYIESLPKNGRASLGDAVYRGITVDYFDPDQFLSTMNLSSDHKILDLKNRIEASIIIWKRKMNQKDGKSTWGSAVSMEKREQFEERAETILLLIKQHFPGIPQSQLDISKIQYNKDVGHAVLESYSRILESLAFTVLSRIDDVLFADKATRTPSTNGRRRSPLRQSPEPQAVMLANEESDRLSTDTNSSMTLSDVMGWNLEQNETAEKKDPYGFSDDLFKDKEKLSDISTVRKPSYLDNLAAMRSPTARH